MTGEVIHIKVVIMAGGKGTRISQYRSDIPKALIEINGKSVIEHQICELVRNHLTDIIIVVGHLGEQIVAHLERVKMGAEISYFVENEPLGTAGALAFMKEDLVEDFLVINGDLIFSLDFSPFIAQHSNTREAIATVIVHSNDHPEDSAAIVLNDSDKSIFQWYPKNCKHDIDNSIVNAGIHILSPEIFNYISKQGESMDLEVDILRPLIKTKRIFTYYTKEYIKDMGTIKRRIEVEQDVINHII